jgi:predicted ATPase/DNA-binding CsgD family transcriptional regulator
MSLSLVSPVLIGRLQELSVLLEALARAEAGEPATVVVAGEAGVGKSRLVAQAAEGAREAGARVLTGGCVELGGDGIPVAPLVAALRQLARTESPAELDALLGPARRSLARLLPELDPEAAMGSGGDGRTSQLLEFVLAVVERLAADRPLMLVIEDLHWADQSTLELVAFLVRALHGARVVLVLTYRSDELHRAHPLRPLVRGWDRVRSVERVALERFTPEEVGAQLASIVGEPPGQDTVESVFERSEGNAFLVEEIFGAVRAGADPYDLPPSLRDVLLTRAEQLSDAGQRILRMAAVGGRSVPERLLAAVAGLPEAALHDALREVVDHQLLVVDDAGRGYAFRHALARDAVYEEMLPGERVRLHTAYGEALDADPSLAGEETSVAATVAHHWSAAHDLPRALRASVQAARQAAAYAPAEAQRHLERALELWPRVPDADALAGMDQVEAAGLAVDAAWRAGNIERSISLAGEALATLAPEAPAERRALLLTRKGRSLRDIGGDALAPLREAEALLPADPPSRALAVVLESLATTLFRQMRIEQALATARRAVTVARAVGAASEEASGLLTMGISLAYEGDAEQGLPLAREGLEKAQAIGDFDSELRGYINLSDACEMLGRHEEAAAVARAGIARADGVGMARTAGAFLLGNAAEPLVRLGRWEEARAVIDAALERHPSTVSAASLLELRGELLAWRGEHDAAAADARAARRLLGEAMETQFLQPLALIEAEVARGRGDLNAAADAIAAGLRDAEDDRSARYAWPLVWQGLRVAGELARQGRDARAAPLRALAGRLATVSPADRAYAALAAAEAAALDGDDGGWAPAVAAWREADEAHPLAYALLRAGDAALRAADRAAASGALDEAAALARALGAAPLQEAVGALARRARLQLDGAAAPPDPADEAERLGLTPREREVLQLLADGRSNQQIAESLFISPKTASVHVSNILGKLDAATRGEAAAVAHRRGLLG